MIWRNLVCLSQSWLTVQVGQVQISSWDSCILIILIIATHPCIAALTCYNVCVSMKSSWWHLLSLRDGKVVCLLLKLRQVERPRLLSGQKYHTLTMSRLIFKPETDFLERWKDLRNRESWEPCQALLLLNGSSSPPAERTAEQVFFLSGKFWNTEHMYENQKILRAMNQFIKSPKL